MKNFIFETGSGFVCVTSEDYNEEDGVTDSIKATKIANQMLADTINYPGYWKLAGFDRFVWEKNPGR